MSPKGTILLVDDNEDFVRSTTDLLEAHGYPVISALDGASGLEMARQRRPDLMVLDVMMATKTEGFEIARKIPSCPELRTMPVLLVTGIRSEMKLGFRLEPDQTWLPVSRIMEKPIEPAAFLAAIGEMLRRRSQIDLKHGVMWQVKGILAGKEPHLWTIAPEASVFEAVTMMDKYRITALPVTDGGRLVGICTEQDCLRSVVIQGRPPKDTLVRSIMTPQPATVTPEDTIEECMSLMTHKRVRHLPVVQDGALVGIVSIGDMVRSVVSQKNALIEQLETYIVSG